MTPGRQEETPGADDADDGRAAARPRPARPVDEPPLLPDVADEDRPEAWGERPDPEGADDDRYLRERPPHW